MLKSRNSDPRLCAENLLRIVRGEVAYDRVRGIDGRIIDQPDEEARFQLEQDALWNIENYEPRIKVDEINISAETVDGNYRLSVNVSEKDEE